MDKMSETLPRYSHAQFYFCLNLLSPMLLALLLGRGSSYEFLTLLNLLNLLNNKYWKKGETKEKLLSLSMD